MKNQQETTDALWDALAPSASDLQSQKPVLVKKPRAHRQVAALKTLKVDYVHTPYETEHPTVVQWLRAYTGNFEFYISVRDQFEKRGELSEKQTAAIYKAIERTQPQASKPVSRPTPVQSKPQTFDQARATYKPGILVQLTGGFAKILAREVGLSYSYRNIEIVETLRETEKAVHVKIRFTPQFSTHCAVCGCALTNDVSRATGIGPICAQKMDLERYTLENAQEVLKQIESKLQMLGEKTVWIPRRAVKRILNGAAVEEVFQDETDEDDAGLPSSMLDWNVL